MAERKIPLRKCVGCGEMKDKRSLVRIVRAKDGSVSVDITGKMPGRGAYICKDADCLKAAQKSKRLEKSFSAQLEPEIYERLRAELSE